MLKLPEALEAQIQIEVDEYEEQQNMRYITSFERLAQKAGVEEGKKKALKKDAPKRYARW